MSNRHTVMEAMRNLHDPRIPPCVLSGTTIKREGGKYVAYSNNLRDNLIISGGLPFVMAT